MHTHIPHTHTPHNPHTHTQTYTHNSKKCQSQPYIHQILVIHVKIITLTCIRKQLSSVSIMYTGRLSPVYTMGNYLQCTPFILGDYPQCTQVIFGCYIQCAPWISGVYYENFGDYIQCTPLSLGDYLQCTP
ncbi:hypothetical protein NP493_19g13059 [Ridgeia piscesae]|uniref:Uncharacterized protein n=1 Tax=Ridgeia piscesae TaxID=27915 RepID=A0AAD9PDW0_RIDPI|nr:hypothetical protein NP493_19g13059 [Ridgeia piscesae]